MWRFGVCGGLSLALLVACDDSAGGGGAPDVPVRGPSDAGDGGAGPMVADAEPIPDAGAALRACADDNAQVVVVSAGVARALTDAAGRAWLVDADQAIAWQVEVSDADGQALAGAAVGLAVGATGWTVLIDPADFAPAAWVGPLSGGTVSLDARAQALGGIGTGTRGGAAPLDGPGCLGAARAVTVRSRHVPVGEALAAWAAGNWIDGPCAADPASWAATCAAVF